MVLIVRTVSVYLSVHCLNIIEEKILTVISSKFAICLFREPWQNFLESSWHFKFWRKCGFILWGKGFEYFIE